MITYWISLGILAIITLYLFYIALIRKTRLSCLNQDLQALGFPRSGKWQTLRKQVLAEETTCTACGGTEDLVVHHCVPFHMDREKELDKDNLIVLCEKNNCHLLIGHLASFRSYNKHVRIDAATLLEKIKNRP